MRYRYRLDYTCHYIDGNLKGQRLPRADRFVHRGDVEAFMMCIRDAKVIEVFSEDKNSCGYRIENPVLVDLKANESVPL